MNRRCNSMSPRYMITQLSACHITSQLNIGMSQVMSPWGNTSHSSLHLQIPHIYVEWKLTSVILENSLNKRKVLEAFARGNDFSTLLAVRGKCRQECQQQKGASQLGRERQCSKGGAQFSVQFRQYSHLTSGGVINYLKHSAIYSLQWRSTA